MGRGRQRIGDLSYPLKRFLRGILPHSQRVSAPPAASIGSVPPDLAVSLHQTLAPRDLQILAGSHIGRSHRINGVPRQDAYFSLQWGPFIIAGISDGVSSSPLSHMGSGLVAEEVGSLVVEALAKQLGDLPIAWSDVNLTLSKKLVTLYLEWKKRHAEPVPEGLTAIREAAADLFAVTLEFVVIDTSPRVDEGYSFLFVRICGDGNTFLLSDKKAPKFLSVFGDLKQPKGPVGALPAYDGEPVTKSGVLYPGETLLICSDGIGDQVEVNKHWLKLAKRVTRGRTLSHGHLVNFVSYSPAGCFDDQTAIFLKR